MSFEREPMLHTPDDPTGTKTVRGKDLEGKTQTLVKTLPQQLQLFQMFLPDDDERYSNTMHKAPYGRTFNITLLLRGQPVAHLRHMCPV
jgi:hypothetical protein